MLSIHNRSRSGMTLIELMAVILIIGIVFGYGVIAIGSYTEKAKYSAVWLDITSLTTAVILSSAEVGDVGAYFTGMANPAAYSVFTSKLNQQYSDMRDPWGAAYSITADTPAQTITIKCTSQENDPNGNEIKRIVSFKNY